MISDDAWRMFASRNLRSHANFMHYDADRNTSPLIHYPNFLNI